MSAVWEDPAVARGFAAQLRRRRAKLDGGAVALGWKLGFGTPAARERFGLAGPLVGYLLEEGRIQPGATCRVSGWTKPLLEPEIAVHVGADLVAGSGREQASAAIAGIGLALELVDLDGPLEHLERVVAGNIFHRGVVLGPTDESRAGGDAGGLAAILYRDGTEVARTEEPLAAVGDDLVGLTSHVADALDAMGERLRAGEVIISGAVVAPLEIEGGEQIRFELAPLGSLELRLERDGGSVGARPALR